MPSSILSFLTAILATVGLLLGGGSAALASLVPAAVEGPVEEAAAEESETNRVRRGRRLVRRTATTTSANAPAPVRRPRPARRAIATPLDRWARTTPRRGPPPGST